MCGDLRRNSLLQLADCYLVGYGCRAPLVHDTGGDVHALCCAVAQSECGFS